MPTAEIISITTRRNALRFGLGATVAGLVTPAIAVPNGDAELIAQCAETTRLRGTMNAVVDAMMELPVSKADRLQADLDEATFAYYDAVKLIASCPAVSPAGVRAKAAVLRDNIEEELGICDGEVVGETHDKLAWSLACDLAAPG